VSAEELVDAYLRRDISRRRFVRRLVGLGFSLSAAVAYAKMAPAAAQVRPSQQDHYDYYNPPGGSPGGPGSGPGPGAGPTGTQGQTPGAGDVQGESESGSPLDDEGETDPTRIRGLPFSG
jgi:hypothetical protein